MFYNAFLSIPPPQSELCSTRPNVFWFICLRYALHFARRWMISPHLHFEAFLGLSISSQARKISLIISTAKVLYLSVSSCNGIPRVSSIGNVCSRGPFPPVPLQHARLPHFPSPVAGSCSPPCRGLPAGREQPPATAVKAAMCARDAVVAVHRTGHIGYDRSLASRALPSPPALAVVSPDPRAAVT